MAWGPLVQPLHDAVCTEGNPVGSPVGAGGMRRDGGELHESLHDASPVQSSSRQSERPSESLSWKSLQSSTGVHPLTLTKHRALHARSPFPSPRLPQVL